MNPEEYVQAYREFVALAEELFAAGRSRAGGEMLFGALSQVIIAIAIQRPAPFREHQHRRRIIRELAGDCNDPTMVTDFGFAQRLHVHFYLNNMDDADFDAAVAATRALIGRLLPLAA